MTKHPSRRRLVRLVDDLPPNHWMARQLPSGASLRGYAEDRAISMLTRVAEEAIEHAGLTRSDVARALGTTKSYVSQVLNGSTNMTLKTFGALLWASGRQVGGVRTDVIGVADAPPAIPVLTATALTTADSDRTYSTTGLAITFFVSTQADLSARYQ